MAIGTGPGDIRVLIFDLDGTLIDSKLDLALAVNATRRAMGLEPLAHEPIYGYIGHGAPMLIRRALGPGASENQIEAGLDFFLRYYRDHMLDNTRAYPGVPEALERMQGRALAVLTNKPVVFSREILAGLGLEPLFRWIYGGNSFEKKKPDPMGVEAILKEAGARPRQAIVVGDSEIDVATGRNARTWTCGVTYGLGSEGLRANPPDLLVGNLIELAEWLDKR